MASLNPMYDMLERNMDQPLTALSKIPIFKRRKVVLIAFLYSNSPYFYSPYCKLHLRTFCTELGSKKSCSVIPFKVYSDEGLCKNQIPTCDLYSSSEVGFWPEYGPE